ncbi:unnamed protein product [Tuber aestivum]|uniref:PNPLA domain-containing protein n=1 Tax=Tuber aestivum TaxID=59557 RepID=A0A292PWN8_9PEZI|nr:unnamed protein product [Tuber aestivum]
MPSIFSGARCSTEPPTNCDQSLSWCSQCESVLCGVCWKIQVAHRPATASGARAKKKLHEKTNLEIAEYILAILEPNLTDDEIRDAHISNVRSRWFGMEIDNRHSVQALLKSKRFLELTSGSEIDPALQYPCLVSFVGETGGGATEIEGVTPVIGNQPDSPTSADVHLFLDPKTINTTRPICFADCEGFGGGNRAPLCTRAKESYKKFKFAHYPHRTKTRKRKIEIAEKYTRQWAVEKLKLETHIVDLLTWADNAFEKSLNQPMLPNAIIIVNGLESNDNTGSNWWDVDWVTQDQLKKLKDRISIPSSCEPLTPRLTGSAQIHSEGIISRAAIIPDFVGKLANHWRTEQKKSIMSLQDLILCYYSDFKIICIPSANDPPHIINQQYSKLRELIVQGARCSENARKLAGLLMTGEDLDYYLERGFDHFCSSKLPFNFLQAAVRAKPVPITFSDHLLRTSITLLKQQPDDNGKCLLGKLAPIFASSILLDVIRKKIPYKAIEIGNTTRIFETYREQCETAQKELYQKYWCCEKRDHKGRRCANRQNGHQKGHQNYKGRVFGAGAFWAESVLDSPDLIEFFNQEITTDLEKRCNYWEAKLPEIQKEGFEEEKKVALETHIALCCATLYRHRGPYISKLTSHTTCSFCLISTPLYPLFCGHAMGTSLESDSQSSNFWASDTLLRWYKLLANIFSGGGIVAAGLGIGKFSIAECIQKFRQVSKQAFVKRPGIGSIIGPVIEAQHHSRYRSVNLDRALQNAFGEKSLLFGGQRDPTGEPTTRVGVSTTTSTGRAFLLANYQRSPLTHSIVGRFSYEFYRGETAEEELKIWEALRATAAAPRYFKSFYHKPSGHTFDDGGIRYNNPVLLANTERKVIWPEKRDRDPDILLSIGTLKSTQFRSNSKVADKQNSKPRLGLRQYIRKVWKIAANAIEDDLDCENTWHNFFDSLNIPETGEYRKRKYCRLNPKIPEPLPALDSVARMDELENRTRQYCKESPEVRNVALTLTASLFYFELKGAKESPQQVGTRMWSCNGEILCRLPANSDSLMLLCDRLKKHNTGNNSQPWFYIGSENYDYEPLYETPDSITKTIQEVSGEEDGEEDKEVEDGQEEGMEEEEKGTFPLGIRPNSAQSDGYTTELMRRWSRPLLKKSQSLSRMPDLKAE